MRSEIDEIALQGIEFWSNVCDEEVDLAIFWDRFKMFFPRFFFQEQVDISLQHKNPLLWLTHPIPKAKPQWNKFTRRDFLTIHCNQAIPLPGCYREF